ncbi:MAG TPA: TolC family protein [Candidatus Polarisedimenticolia bacterium]|nr:TolC family protein [Candidatus Polarisedimenticolia bacterium]
MALWTGIVAGPNVARAEERGSSPRSAGDVLTLEQAVALALENNRLVRNAALEAAKAVDSLASFRTNRLPAIDLTALESQTLADLKFRFPAGAFGDFPATGPIPSRDTDVTAPGGRTAFVFGRITQPLLQLPRIGLGVRLKALNLEVAREKLRAQRQSTVSDVKSAYYSLLDAQSALDATDEAVRALRELDRVVGERVAQQTALRAEALAVESRLASEEHQALRLVNALASGRERLNDLLARDLDTAFSVSQVPDPAPNEADLAAARAEALARRADVREARLTQKQAEIDQRLKRWDYVPDLSLMADYVSFYNLDVLPRDFRSVGLFLTWEPFDWGRRGRALAESKKGLEQARNAVRETESLAVIDVGLKFRALEEARSLLRATGLAQEAARERLKVTTNRYAQKAALLKDVLEDQEHLADANRQQQAALLSAWTARADLERALGED